jgi:hypothetical protein
MQLLRCHLAVRVLVVAAECVWLISKEIEMSTNDGGNAFPVADYDHMAFQPATVDEHKRQLSGMSLRDYFAAKAIRVVALDLEDQIETLGRRVAFIELADHAYMLADAMLAARSK